MASTLKLGFAGRHFGTLQPISVGRVRSFESALVLIGLLVFFGTFRTLLASGADDREAGSLVFQLVTLSIYGGGFLFLLRGFPAWTGRLMAKVWPLLLLTGLAFVSTLWSDAPSTTFRRAVALLLMTSFAFYVVLRFELKEFLRILIGAFVIFFVVAFVSAALGPGITGAGIHQGAWQALTGQKNEFGRTCGLALTIFLALFLLVRPDWRLRCLAGAFVGFCLLVLSTSKTPITATAAAIGGTMLAFTLLHGRFGRFRLGLDIRVGLTILLIPTVAFLVFWLVPFIVEAMGRDLTFSGRTELWKWAINLAGDTPWFGSGYRGFWNDGNTRYFFESFAWGRTLDGELSDSFAGPTHAHSGYVDLWIELGWVGVCAYALLIVTTFKKVGSLLRAGERGTALLLSVTCWFLLAYAFTAKSILQQSEDLWFLFIVFYLFAERNNAENDYLRL